MHTTKLKPQPKKVEVEDPRKKHLYILKKIAQTYEIPFGLNWTNKMRDDKIDNLYSEKRALEVSYPWLNR